MKYVNGKDVLPPELLKEVQKYVSGEIVYVPKQEMQRASWGHISGARQQVHARNSRIVDRYRTGTTVNELIQEFCLSEASIRKIIYTHK